jgi:hypothetical protein
VRRFRRSAPLKLNIYNIELSKQKNIKIICFALFRSYSGNESYIGGKYIDLTMPKGILLL